MSKKIKYNIWGVLSGLLLIGLDQWTKMLAVRHLKNQAPVVLWEGVFELNYLENRGAAFGMLQGQKVFFLITTAIVLVLLTIIYYRLPDGKRFHPLRAVGVMLVAGAIGNLIDRSIQSYVVDFFYFKLIDFPVFNVADCYVTVGAFLMALLILFYYKDEELEFLNFRKKDGREDTI